MMRKYWLPVCTLTFSLLALTFAPCLAQQATFSAAPTVPLHDYDLAVGQQVQRFNGFFAQRLIQQSSTPAARACLRANAKSALAIETYGAGSIRVGTSLAACSDALNTQGSAQTISPAQVGTPTSQVSLPAARVLALVLANDLFNSQGRFARNDRNLSHYDVQVFDKDGMIRVTIEPTVRIEHNLFLGCPPTGPITTTFLIDPSTFAAKVGRMVC